MHIKVFLLSSLSIVSIAHTQVSLPKITLPWGTYQAKVLDTDHQIYIFKNVRFGAMPVRFGASDFPQEPDRGGVSVTDCLQINPHVLKTPPGGKTHLGDPNDDLGPGESYTTKPDWSGVEDCLFLDVYVPVSVFNKAPPQQLPVTVWFYGGAYAFGTKRMSSGPLYSGESLIKASGYNIIYVAGNYRLGAFGWLSGSFMEKNGLPNAGLYDQNLLLRWVQKYIGQVHGDNSRVSAWGESAGGGSILHHLIRDDGNKDPLFSRFVTQSPAFEWAWDNSPNGHLDQVYYNFSNSLGCHEPYNIECLRSPSITTEQLAAANLRLFNQVKQTGLFPIGPAVDGIWIKTIPTLAFSQGNFWRGIKSAIVSHCANDAQSFTPASVTDNATFTNFLAMFLPGEKLSSTRTRISTRYNCEKTYNGNYKACLKDIIRDVSFTCNTRNLLASYPEHAYAMNYGYPNDHLAYHATDLIPLFANPGIKYIEIISFMFSALGYNLIDVGHWAWKVRSQVMPIFTNYFASFALHGNTNSSGDSGWPVVDGTGDLFSSVMKPSSGGWNLSQDDQNSKSTCSFWNEIAQDIINTKSDVRRETEYIMGYVDSSILAQEEL